MNSISPTVSVCMITYNHEKYIAQAIDSVLMQKTNFDYEIVIGEDCSTDKTREIVLEYKAKYPDKIKLLLQEKNVGMMQNFIDTLKTCTGKYIALLEGDDYWTDPYKLQKQVDILEAHPEYVLTFHQIFILHPNGEMTKHLNYEKKNYNLEDLINGNFVPTCSVVFRNIPIEFPTFYKRLKIGDYPLYFLLIKYGEFYFLNFNMAIYRLHKESYFSSKDELFALNAILEVYLSFVEYYPNLRKRLLKRIIRQYYSIALNYNKQKKNKNAIFILKNIYSYFPEIFYSPYYLKAIIKILLGLKV
jgi:glycosyltransferase involved in cell wall biosynthesis